MVASAATATAVFPTSAGALTLGVTTKSPQDVATTSATLRADVTVPVLGANVTWEYGTTTRYGASTRAISASILGITETLTLPTSGLAANTTYHVRAVAASGLTTNYGRDVTFTTDKASASGSGSGDDDQGDDNGGSGSSGSGAGSTPAPTTPTPSTTSGDNSSSSSSDKSKDKDKAKSEATPSTSAAPTGKDPAAGIVPGTATAAVTPVLGKTLAIAAVQGTVSATSPSGAPVDLSAPQGVPTGTVIDTRAGTVELTTAIDRAGTTQTGRFWGGLFEVRQSALARGLTQLVLRGVNFSACGSAGTVARAATSTTKKKKKKKKKPTRTLWGSDDNGRFQTRGRGSVATVRGTRWMTRDTCAGTLTRVTAGAVAVKDLRRNTTVVVKRGHEYLARVRP
jgi:hypothetical protein